MGMSIEELKFENNFLKQRVKELTAEKQMFRVDYEARLKADKLAMLTELQLEIEERPVQGNDYFCNEEEYREGYLQADTDTIVLIQEKINILKGGEK